MAWPIIINQSPSFSLGLSWTKKKRGGRGKRPREVINYARSDLITPPSLFLSPPFSFNFASPPPSPLLRSLDYQYRFDISVPLFLFLSSSSLDRKRVNCRNLRPMIERRKGSRWWFATSCWCLRARARGKKVYDREVFPREIVSISLGECLSLSLFLFFNWKRAVETCIHFLKNDCPDTEQENY